MMSIQKLITVILGTAVILMILSGCNDNAALSGTSALTPEGVVESFYTWYLGYPGNAMADGRYKSSEYLSVGFIAKVDEIIASFEHGGYDPFLQAQDIPDSFTVDKAEIGANTAIVMVHTSFPGHVLRVELEHTDGQWKITDITRAEMSSETMPIPTIEVTPKMVVENFYRWYIYSSGSPFLDGVYRTNPYLTTRFVQELDGARDSFSFGDRDPLLCSSAIPTEVSIERTYMYSDEARVVVRANLEALDLVYDFAVNVNQVEGEWKIDDVVCLASDDAARTVTREPTSAVPLRIPTDETQIFGWQVFRDDTYGYRIEYPGNWVAEAIPLQASGVNTPIKRVVGFAPRSWDEMYSPVILEVSIGTMEEFRRIYPEPAARERVTLKGNAVAVEDSGYGLVRYVFENSRSRELRVTIQDMVSDFPDRASGNEDIVEIIKQMLGTFRFTK